MNISDYCEEKAIELNKNALVNDNFEELDNFAKEPKYISHIEDENSLSSKLIDAYNSTTLPILMAEFSSSSMDGYCSIGKREICAFLNYTENPKATPIEMINTQISALAVETMCYLIEGQTSWIPNSKIKSIHDATEQVDFVVKNYLLPRAKKVDESMTMDAFIKIFCSNFPVLHFHVARKWIRYENGAKKYIEDSVFDLAYLDDPDVPKDLGWYVLNQTPNSSQWKWIFRWEKYK